jgi:hypothetical protein
LITHGRLGYVERWFDLGGGIAAFRLQHQPPEAPLRAGGISTLAVVIGAELCIAFVILSRTSLLVMVAPQP